jgi:hypothetical protein
MSTLFVEKLLGLYLIAISVGMVAGGRRTLATLNAMANSGPWMLFSGMVATAVGLAMILAHNVWSGCALSLAVTLIGWTALLKGLALLLVPPDAMAALYKAANYERYFVFWMGVVLALGAWMTWQAFTS